jgi:sugar phosphate isomerase/epimerase
MPHLVMPRKSNAMPHDPLTLSPERCFHADPARHDVWRRVSCDWLARQWWRASGSGGYDYAGFMMVLHKIGYDQRISAECRWNDLATDAAPALAFMREQWRVEPE